MSRTFFDYGDQKESERIVRETWEEFREKVSKDSFLISDIESAKGITFLKVFDDIFNHQIDQNLLVRSLSDYSGYKMMRGSILKDGDSDFTYKRLEPISRYMKSENRFSPPGVEWMYLSLAKKCGNAQCGVIKELRAKKGDNILLGKYRIPKKHEKRKIIDLTIAKSITKDSIIAEHDRSVKQSINNAVYEFIREGNFNKSSVENEKALIKCVVMLYAHEIDEQLFVPVDGLDKQYMYKPFQCISQYFLQKSYDGIVYSSTVCSESKNIVLFDKTIPLPMHNPEKIMV